MAQLSTQDLAQQTGTILVSALLDNGTGDSFLRTSNAAVVVYQNTWAAIIDSFCKITGCTNPLTLPYPDSVHAAVTIFTGILPNITNEEVSLFIITPDRESAVELYDILNELLPGVDIGKASYKSVGCDDLNMGKDPTLINMKFNDLRLLIRVLHVFLLHSGGLKTLP